MSTTLLRNVEIRLYPWNVEEVTALANSNNLDYTVRFQKGWTGIFFPKILSETLCKINEANPVEPAKKVQKESRQHYLTTFSTQKEVCTFFCNETSPETAGLISVWQMDPAMLWECTILTVIPIPQLKPYEIVNFPYHSSCEKFKFTYNKLTRTTVPVI